jgi:hypothetical protein
MIALVVQVECNPGCFLNHARENLKTSIHATVIVAKQEIFRCICISMTMAVHSSQQPWEASILDFDRTPIYVPVKYYGLRAIILSSLGFPKYDVKIASSRNSSGVVVINFGVACICSIL